MSQTGTISSRVVAAKPWRRGVRVASLQSSTSKETPKASQFLRPHLLDLAPYTPIQPFEILSQKLGRKPEEIVKLDANENPYGPPPEVLQALGSISFPHIYPDPESGKLRKALEDWTGVPKERLLVGCGCDELIDLLMRCILDPGDSIIDCPPTFTMYNFDADVNAANVVTVPRLADFRIDVEGIRQAVNEHRPKAVFLTSPNNPDGSLISEEDLLAVLGLPVLVVLDEAYIEFSDIPSRLGWVERFPNLVVLRTFSKCAALAGVRVGYGSFPEGLIEYVWRAKQPYNVSVVGEVAACAALSNQKYIKSVRDLLVAERGRLMEELLKIDFLEPYPSESNFILCKVKNGLEARQVKAHLENQYGIMIRHYEKKELSGYVRISVGKPEQTDSIVAALKELQSQGGGNGAQ
ncbi:hypothetical protein BSKO_09036 [Bryopsis sp. KO-2023]|nr:hypothetical protein BSKO_09036 [Bryopsis sp. KO-2023]